MRRATILVLAALAACASPSGTVPTTPDAGDAAMTTNDASTDASSSTDAAILPDVGSWAWAEYEAQQGRYIRRTSWPSGALVRLNGPAYQMSSTGGASWFATNWTPSSDDTNATNWTSRAP